MTHAYSSHRGHEAALVILLSLLGLLALPRPAHGLDVVADSSVLYTLVDASAFEVGCFGPCDCAVRSSHVGGSFRLRRTATGPLVTTYAVEDLRATIEMPEGPRPATGSGTYEVGGEFADTQRLQLDLVIDDYAQHFDSGAVPGGGGFPRIDVTLAAHEFACHDTVIRVVAEPATASAPVPEPRGSALRASPNPFRGATELRLAAPVRPGVEARIVDAQGREVASLPSGGPSAEGQWAWTWDGRGRDGAPLGPGVYFGVVRAPGSEWSRRIVKLE